MCLCVAELYRNCVCSSTPWLAKGRDLKVKPRLSIPGSCSPINQNGELKRKVSSAHPAPYKARISC